MQLTRETWLVGFCLLAVVRVAAAQPIEETRASASLVVYSDDDHMTVVSPSAGAQVPVTDRVGFDLNVSADVITGASVDVISEASPTAIDETRLEGGAGLVWAAYRLLSLRTRVIVSHEKDYESARVTVGANVQLAQRNTTLDASYSGGQDEVGHALDSTFSESRTSHKLTTTVTQVIDPRTYVDVVVEGQRSAGYHASSYRTVPIIDLESSALVRVTETTPRVRTNLATVARVRRAIDTADRFMANASYRFYVDDWGITSHTLSANQITRLSDRAQLGLMMRAYTQGAADFHRAVYNLEMGEVPALRTRERRLGRMHSLSSGATFDYALTERGDQGPRVVAAGSLMRFWWPDFPAQTSRNALAMTVGVSSLF